MEMRGASLLVFGWEDTHSSSLSHADPWLFTLDLLEQSRVIVGPVLRLSLKE